MTLAWNETSGTTDTEAIEFNQIYGLNVIIIPTNVPMVRNDHNDLVFLTKKAKYKALVEEIVSLRENHAPILVGTVSVESSEEVSEFLKAEKIPHQILNAKHHEKEAEVIANAGKPSMVTIATNMAGRGTDIVLGGKKEDQDNDEWFLINSLSCRPIQKINKKELKISTNPKEFWLSLLKI